MSCLLTHSIRLLTCVRGGVIQAILRGRNDTVTIFSTDSVIILSDISAVAGVSGLQSDSDGNEIVFFQQPLAGTQRLTGSALGAVGTLTPLPRVGGAFSATLEFTQFGPANVGELLAAVQTSCCESPPSNKYVCVGNPDPTAVEVPVATAAANGVTYVLCL